MGILKFREGVRAHDDEIRLPLVWIHVRRGLLFSFLCFDVARTSSLLQCALVIRRRALIDTRCRL